jgi:hypothetical protein
MSTLSIKKEVTNLLYANFSILDTIVDTINMIDREIPPKDQLDVYKILKSIEISGSSNEVPDNSSILMEKMKGQKFGIVEACIIDQINKKYSVYDIYKVWYPYKDIINQLCIKFQIDSKLFDIFNDMSGIEVEGGRKGGGIVNMKFLLSLLSLFLLSGMFMSNVFNLKTKATGLKESIVGVSDVARGASSVAITSWNSGIPKELMKRTPLKKLLSDQSIKDPSQLVNQFLDNVVAPEERTSVAQHQEQLFLKCNANGGTDCLHLAKFQLVNGMLGLVQNQDRAQQTNGAILVASRVLDTLLTSTTSESKFIRLLAEKLTPGITNSERKNFMSTQIVKSLSVWDTGTLVTFQDIWKLLPLIKPSMDNAKAAIEKILEVHAKTKPTSDRLEHQSEVLALVRNPLLAAVIPGMSATIYWEGITEKGLRSALAELDEYGGMVNTIDELYKTLDSMGFNANSVAISDTPTTSPGGIQNVVAQFTRGNAVDPLHDEYYRGGKSRRTKRKLKRKTMRNPKHSLKMRKRLSMKR